MVEKKPSQLESDSQDVIKTEPLPLSRPKGKPGIGEDETMVAESDPGPPVTRTLPPEAGDSVSSEEPDRYQPVDPRSGGSVALADDAELARGGMGRILCVFDRHTSRQVALKERLDDRGSADTAPGEGSGDLSPDDARFLHEAKVTAQLEHPNIVPVYEIGQRPSGAFYYTMQKVKGKTLGRHLSECGSLAERMEYLPHFMNLCHAMAYAHDKRIIHRDLKPDNVMIGPFGETIVLDWGLAKIIGAPEKESDRRLMEHLAEIKDGSGGTVDGYAVGTPSYLPPEQARGELTKIDQRSDVYSLGAVLYEILAGRPPYKGASALETIAQVLNKPYTPLKTVERKVPRELEEMVNTAMARDPDDRYLNASELADQVGQFLAGKFVPPPRGGTVAWFKYVWRERRGLLIASMLAAFAVIGGWGLHSRALDEERANAAELALRLHAAEALVEHGDRERQRLVGTVLASQVDEYAGTPSGLALAAEALALNDGPLNRSLLYREATARPYGIARRAVDVGGACELATLKGETPPVPVCLVDAARVGGGRGGRALWLDPESGTITREVELPVASPREVGDGGVLTVGDDRFVLGGTARDDQALAALAALGEEGITGVARLQGERGATRVIAVDLDGELHDGKLDPGTGRWSFRHVAVHGAPVESVLPWKGGILTSDEAGVVKLWADPFRHLRARMSEPVPVFDRASDFDGRGHALLRTNEGIELHDVSSGQVVREMVLPGLSSVRLTRDGWSALAVTGPAGRRELHQLAVVGEPGVVTWAAALADASGVWPIDRPGARMAVLSSDRGVFQVVNLDERGAVGGPRTWGESRGLVALIADAYGSRLALLDEAGTVTAGGLQAARPDWTWRGRGVARIATTADGKQLVMMGEGGTLSVTSFAGPGEVVGPCGPEEKPRVARDGDGLASCMERPMVDRALLLAPFDARRVLIVAPERLVVYDLARGGPSFGYRLEKVDRAWTGGTMEEILLERETAAGIELATIPTAAWIMSDQETLMRTIKGATGLTTRGGEIVPLSQEEWSALESAPHSETD